VVGDLATLKVDFGLFVKQPVMPHQRVNKKIYSACLQNSMKGEFLLAAPDCFSVHDLFILCYNEVGFWLS
jgi:hypothetical protein